VSTTLRVAVLAAVVGVIAGIAIPTVKTGMIFVNQFSSLATLSNVNLLYSSAMGFTLECVFAVTIAYLGYLVLRPRENYAELAAEMEGSQSSSSRPLPNSPRA